MAKKERTKILEMDDIFIKPITLVNPVMTPEVIGPGFKMNIGSKENFSKSNFSSKDQSTISSPPSIIKDDFGGETIEVEDQGSPLNYGKRSNISLARKMTDAENLAMGQKSNQERQRQYLKDGMAIAQTVGNIAGTIAGASDRRLKKDIKLISVSPSGINIYNFKYKDTKHGEGEFQGVMSDDIPYNAVVSHKDGFDRVDYSKLDVEFKAL